MKPEKFILIVVEVKKGPIYKTNIELKFERGVYCVYKDTRLLTEKPTKHAALIRASENILKGFNRPGFYTAIINDVPYAQREVKRK